MHRITAGRRPFSRRYSPEQVTGGEGGRCSSECNHKAPCGEVSGFAANRCPGTAFLPRRQRNQVGCRIFVEEDQFARLQALSIEDLE